MAIHQLSQGSVGLSDDLELTILMPCLNEAETLALCIDKARSFLTHSGVAGEVLIADNGSTDGSQEIARAHGAKVVAVRDRGYGAALMGGIAAARGRFVIMGDADDSYDFTALMPFVERLRQGEELVMGNRFDGGIKDGAMPPLHRYLGNPVLTAVGRLFFGSPARDFHCGLRGFNRASIVNLGLVCSGMEFASEMVVKATVNRLRIAEVPTTLSPDGRSRPPHLRTWRDGWRHLRFLLMFSPKWLFLYPGLLLFSVGAIAMMLLAIGDRTIGGVTFGVNTLAFSAAATVGGFQAASFWLFARYFAGRARLLPISGKVMGVASFYTVELGLMVGVVLIVIGMATGIGAVGYWREAGYGVLDPTLTMRVVIPSMTAMILGLQMAFGSFMFGILGLEMRQAKGADSQGVSRPAVKEQSAAI